MKSPTAESERSPGAGRRREQVSRLFFCTAFGIAGGLLTVSPAGAEDPFNDASNRPFGSSRSGSGSNTKNEINKAKYGAEDSAHKEHTASKPEERQPESAEFDGAIKDTSKMFELPSQRPSQHLHAEDERSEDVIEEVKKKLEDHQKRKISDERDRP